MEGIILRTDVFEAIQSGEPFDMVFISCDRRRGTGGELITVDGWMKITSAAGEKSTAAPQVSGTSGQTKDPNHFDNGTVNVFNPANSGVHPISVHIDLIQFFNGKRVIN